MTDAQLRLECLRLAAGDTALADGFSDDVVVKSAKVYADFVLGDGSRAGWYELEAGEVATCAPSGGITIHKVEKSSGRSRTEWRRPNGTALTLAEADTYLRILSGVGPIPQNRAQRLRAAFRVLASFGASRDAR